MNEERPSGRPDAGHDNDDSGVGRRRLLSLAAQRRRKDEEERHRREKLAAEPVVDPGPPDPMIAALEALSGLDADEDEEEDGEPDGVADEEPRLRQETSPAAAPPPPPPVAESAEAKPAESGETAGAGAGGVQIAATNGNSDNGGNGTQPDRLIRTVVRRDEPERPRPVRPSRPVYTLQEVHERTGIPYARLALYAASHADQIPSVGERRSPAYLREGMEAFCRLHALKEPGWEMPDLGPEPGWDDERGLAVRLEALETAQHATADQLRGIVRTLRRPWSGQATWE